MEQSSTYRPSPLMLFKLSKFYGVSQRKLAELAGFVTKVNDEMKRTSLKICCAIRFF